MGLIALPLAIAHPKKEVCMKTTAMLKSHPNPAAYQDVLVNCIDAAFACAQCCTACADACVGGEQPKKMAYCIRTDLDCADICDATGHVLSRQTQPSVTLLKSMLQTCRTACRVCGDECREHAETMEHCRVCGECCRECEQACEQLLAALK